MKRFVVVLSLLLLLVFGCRTPPQTYYNVDKWYVRQNAVPHYFASYDLFYFHPELYHGEVMSITNHDYTVAQTSDMFTNKVRVFAPLCHDEADAKESFNWYLDKYHLDGSPFVFIADGEGVRLMEPLLDDAGKKGLVSVHRGVVTSNTVEEVNECVRIWKYENNWRRDPNKEK